MLFVSTLLVLTGCNVEPEDSPETNNEEAGTNQPTPNVVSENQLGDNYYLPALSPEGTYEPSNNRGITLRMNSGLNIGIFEKDLIRLSQDAFSTSDYYIKEGQMLTSEMVTNWLGRAAEIPTENEEGERSEEAIARDEFLQGLNPTQSPDFNPESGVYDHEARVPNYLESILEFDFYQNSEAENPSGLSIGLAMNTMDYYQDDEYRQFEQEISPEVALEQGQAMANEIVSRLRTVEGLGEIPIMVGIYEQSARDDLAGGVYVATGESLNGSTAIDSWNMLNEERLIFPLEGSNSAEGNAFANFKSEVESYFPNLSGITGRAHYIDEQLVNLSINIMTQFYGEQEIISFAQYLKQSAGTYLPMDLNVEILVESPGNMEAFLKKDRTDSDYFSYVFD